MCFLLFFPQQLAISTNYKTDFYQSPIDLIIKCNDKKAKIYYTLDGSIPDDQSNIYDEPIALGFCEGKEAFLTKIEDVAMGNTYVPTNTFPIAHVIRAIAIDEHGNKSDIISNTYFIGYDREAFFGNTDIICLTTDPSNLFDYNNGIYVLGKSYSEWAAQQDELYEDYRMSANFMNRGMEWERTVTVDFLPFARKGFTQDMGMRIKGTSSRLYGQKSIRLISRKEYGEKYLRYELFEDNLREVDNGIVDQYKSFTLRNGGVDWARTKMRDTVVSTLSMGLNIEIAEKKPCIAFINGEYWGVYTLVEEYSDDYFQYHYGIDDKNIITIKGGLLEDGNDEDSKSFQDMYDYIIENDMSLLTNYYRVAEEIDISSFADYCAVQLYVLNEDGPLQNNNWQMWKVRTPDYSAHAFSDGKWRMMLYDMDYTLGLYTDGDGALVDNLDSVFLKKEYGYRNFPQMLLSLLNNHSFRSQLIRSCCDVRNIFFSKKRTESNVLWYRELYQPYLPTSIKRFGPESVLANPEKWVSNEIDVLLRFFTLRNEVFLRMVGEAFGMKEPCKITIEISDPEKGQVFLNNRMIPIDNGTEVEYFSELNLTVTAVPAPGRRFVGWKVRNGNATLSNEKSTTTTVDFFSSFILEAEFE